MCCHYVVWVGSEILSSWYIISLVETRCHKSIPTCDYGRFFVDKIPIRVLKNLGIKGTYPTQAMQVVGTIWNAKDWAGKIDWSKAPFTAHFQGFDINGCVMLDDLDPGSFRGCYYNHWNAWWSWRGNQTLSTRQGKQYQNVRRKYLDYDYCSDRTRYPDPFPECQAVAPTGIWVIP